MLLTGTILVCITALMMIGFVIAEVGNSLIYSDIKTSRELFVAGVLIMFVDFIIILGFL